MGRTYLRTLTLAAAAGGGVAAAAALLIPSAQSARGLFDSKPLQQQRFAVLAQPVGQSDWKLLVLEQIKQRPLCWTPRPDGLIDPTLNTFNFAGICSRYLDSNGYSLRSGGEDLGTRFRLSLQQKGTTLHLQALSSRQRVPIVIGKASVPRRDRNGFVLMQLQPGWRLERRVYKGRTLSHVYFAHPDPMNQLLARLEDAPNDRFARLGAPKAPLPPRRAGTQRVAAGDPIRLEVIPFRP